MSSDNRASSGQPRERPARSRSISGFFSRRPIFWLTIALGIEVLAVAAFQTPFMRFDRFAIFDSGGELAIQDMLRRGSAPAVDFGYLYGLLPLLLGRIWFGLFGLTPGAFRAAGLVCMLISAWGLARFAEYRRVGPVGVILIAAVIPDLLMVTYASSVQVLEQALLVNALAEQARGRRGAALALLAACCFAKPSLAFLQGLAVVIAIVAANRRAGRPHWVEDFAAAVITGAVLAAILALSFGLAPLLRTCVPLTGMSVYQHGNFGFFRGIGRDFWLLPHAGLRDYFRYELGFWMLGTAVLIVGAVTGLRKLARGDETEDRAIGNEVVATCAAVHIGFVVFLFGHRETWLYSLPMLVLGLATLAPRSRWHRYVLWVLAVLLLVNVRSKAIEVLRRWRTEAPSATTLGLWADPVERGEWQRALELTRGQHPALLAMCDGAALLFPDFDVPIVGYLVPGNALPGEVGRKAAHLAEAPMIISAVAPNWPGFEFWPEIAAALDGCEVVMDGHFLRVYRRVAPPRPPPQHPIAQ